MCAMLKTGANKISVYLRKSDVVKGKVCKLLIAMHAQSFFNTPKLHRGRYKLGQNEDTYKEE